jgi:hypothetical protein
MKRTIDEEKKWEKNKEVGVMEKRVGEEVIWCSDNFCSSGGAMPFFDEGQPQGRKGLAESSHVVDRHVKALGS